MDPWHLIVVRSCLCMFQLASFTISTYYSQLCGSCGADKTCVSTSRSKKMSDRFLEQGLNIKFCVKLRKNAIDTCAVLYEAYGGRSCENVKYFWVVWTNQSIAKTWKMTILVTFFDIKGIAHFEFIPQGQTSKLIIMCKYLSGYVKLCV